MRPRAKRSARSGTGIAFIMVMLSMRWGGRSFLGSRDGVSRAQQWHRLLLSPSRRASIGFCTPSHLLIIRRRTLSAGNWGLPSLRNAPSSILRVISCSAMTGVLIFPERAKQLQHSKGVGEQNLFSVLKWRTRYAPRPPFFLVTHLLFTRRKSSSTSIRNYV